MDTTLELVPALAQAGADVIELGVPFSDPLADGATVQKASFHALEQGVTMKTCLEVCSQAAQRGYGSSPSIHGLLQPVPGLWTEEVRRGGSESPV